MRPSEVVPPLKPSLLYPPGCYVSGLSTLATHSPPPFPVVAISTPSATQEATIPTPMPTINGTPPFKFLK